ncbi:MAG: BatA domain-containing protein, partial [Thermoguttaceae bacterium]
MSFAAPLFLLAAVTAAIPVVLHMLQRRKAKDLPFPTLRFLRRSAEKTRRRKRIQDALLMLLRTAALLLLAVALARPAVTSLGALWGNARTAVAIVLDNSASMGLIDNERARIDTAVAAATQVLDQLGDGDQVAILPCCGPPLADAGRLHRVQGPARQLLRQCRVSYERADLSLRLEQARELLNKSDAPNKQIYVLTDMQRTSWGNGDRLAAADTAVPGVMADVPSAAKQPKSSIPVVLVDCDRAPKPNVAVESLSVNAAVPIAGLPARASVTLRNMAAVAQSRAVELLIDGVKLAESPELTLQPLGRAKHEFTFTSKQGGVHRGLVRLVGDDGSAYDDRRLFAVRTSESVPVAVVKPQRHEIPYLDEGFYLEQALAAGPVAPTVLLPADLSTTALDKYRVLFCIDLPALSDDTAARLAEYVSNGGNVVWICGDNVNC